MASLAALLATPPSLLIPQTPATDAALAAGIRQTQLGEFGTAIITLDGVARRLAAQGGRSKELARAYLYLSIAYLGLNELETAKARFLEGWKADQLIEISAKEFPPKALQFLEQARQEALATEAAAKANAPKPSGKKAESPAAIPRTAPQDRRGGSKKKLVILGLGGAAAVAGGVAIASSGGASGASSGCNPSGEFSVRVTPDFTGANACNSPRGTVEVHATNLTCSTVTVFSVTNLSTSNCASGSFTVPIVAAAVPPGARDQLVAMYRGFPTAGCCAGGTCSAPSQTCMYEETYTVSTSVGDRIFRNSFTVTYAAGAACTPCP
jgi:hypothetical protein